MSRESKAVGLLLDTHIWIDFMLGEAGLQRTVAERIEREREKRAVYISVISVWEIAMLTRKGRLSLPVGPLAWTEKALRLPGIQLLPLSPAVAVRAVELPQELNWDPADRFLVATAESEHLRLVTRDRDILRFAAKFSIPFLNAREKVHDE